MSAKREKSMSEVFCNKRFAVGKACLLPPGHSGPCGWDERGEPAAPEMSAVKMPVAREEARKWVEAVAVAEVGGDLELQISQQMIADIQKRTLLAAAEKFKHDGPHYYEPPELCPACILERLAEQVGREK